MVGVRDGRVDRVCFPWFNYSFPGGKPAEDWAFLRWLETAHPEASRPYQPSTLFGTIGQEQVLILKPKLRLLKTYLDEYERSAI